MSAPFALALWQLAPTPAKARRVREASFAKLLKQHRIRRLTATELRDQLRVEPIAVRPSSVQAATDRVRLLTPVLEAVKRQIADAERRLKRMLHELEHETPKDDEGQTPQPSDAAILRSLPGLGAFGLATFLSEADEALRHRDHEALRCLSGVAPVTVKSGKKLIVMRRLAANQRLNDAAFHWGRVAIQHDPVSRTKYDAMKAQGKTHGRALRRDRRMTQQTTTHLEHLARRWEVPVGSASQASPTASSPQGFRGGVPGGCRQATPDASYNGLLTISWNVLPSRAMAMSCCRRVLARAPLALSQVAMAPSRSPSCIRSRPRIMAACS